MGGAAMNKQPSVKRAAGGHSVPVEAQLGPLTCSKEQATERADLETALARIPEADAFYDRQLKRLAPFFTLQPPATVLDVGAAQGVTLTALAKRGFEAVGVEPWEPAIEVSHQLAEATGLELRIKPGMAEAIPFEDESVDFVNAYSVMEHVDDPDQVFREAFRVLKRPGAFFFTTTSALCPFQGEIAGFPLFPWYPPPLQRRIMSWATENRPALVGNTTRPAIHWFKHRKVRRSLHDAGFDEVVDRWKLRRGERDGMRGRIIDTAASNRGARLLGDLAAGGMEYLAVKR
jgi:2-polyprenyl-3-methyl-5-hydroxy-6-metoxy-1,4-benzoquinol methylase